METAIPVQLDQLLTLALGVAFITQFLKAVARRIGGHSTIDGLGSVLVSAVVAVALTLVSYGAGWATISIPSCDPLQPFACAQGWIATAGSSMALANLLFVVVYGRVFGSGATPSTT